MRNPTQTTHADLTTVRQDPGPPAGGPAASGRPLLEVQGLNTSFVTPRGRVDAVRDVSFRLARGEVLGVVGESGSGKSVLARSVMHLVAGDGSTLLSGSVRLGDFDVLHLSRAQRKHFWGVQMAMVFQDPMTSLNPVKRIGKHLTEPLRFHLGLSRSEAREHACDLLAQVGIPEPRRRLDQYPHELSGGMRQRVVIAMALTCHPVLLLADEPTTALDVTVQRDILDLLGRLSADLGMAMILISHDLGVVAGRTDRIAVMYAGRFVETANTGTLFTQPHHPYTEALLQSIPRLDDPSGTELHTIGGRPPDLLNPPTGCRFAPRCDYVQPECLLTEPPLYVVDDATGVLCNFPRNTSPSADAQGLTTEKEPL